MIQDINYDINTDITFEKRLINVRGFKSINQRYCTKTLLIIGGLNSSVEGFKQKYIRVAEMLKPYMNIVIINNPGPFMKDGYDLVGVGIKVIRDELPFSREIFCWGHSTGGYYLLRYGKEYPEIKRILLSNIPLTVFLYDKIMEGMDKANNCNHIEQVDFVFSEFDQSYVYHSIISEAGYSKVQVHTAYGQDHDFSFSLKEFCELPIKYMLNDIVKGGTNEL